MPVIQRDSHTWPGSAGRDSDSVLGDEEDVLGKKADDAAVVLKTLFGSPYPRTAVGISTTAAVIRRHSYVVRGV